MLKSFLIMLKDTINIKVESGRGGQGSFAKYKKRYIGGDGGMGGNVYLQGNENLHDFTTLNSDKIYKAENGKNGKPNNKKGRRGKDLYIKVPLITEIWVNDKLKCIIKKHGDTAKVAIGALGELGNISQRRNRNIGTIQSQLETERVELNLILKLYSDAIFIGYPNAGKSSMLNEITNANVKTAYYEFTTLDPQIAYMDGIVLMDLPGLIEGTYEGKGLGTKFLKHTEYSKLLIHFVSLENKDPIETYKSLRAEIKNIDEDLYQKEEMVILSKHDEASEGKQKKILRLFENKGIPTVLCSIIDEKSIENVKSKIRKLLNERFTAISDKKSQY